MNIYTSNGNVIFSHNSKTDKRALLEVLTEVSVEPYIRVLGVKMSSQSVIEQINGAVKFEVESFLEDCNTDNQILFS